MRRTLYLHAGTHRTATSSIQGFLRVNFDNLIERGYLNPFAAGRHEMLVNDLFKGIRTPKEVAEDLIRRADAKDNPIHSIILSDEDICSRRNLAVMAKFRDYFDVVVLFSMRRQDLWLESWHQQNVKWQWNPELSHLTFPEFLRRREEFFWIHYDQTVKQLEKRFGAQNLRLRVFERGQMPGGPIECFAEDIGLGSTAGLAPAPQLNSSLLPVVSEFMRTLPLGEFPDAKRARVEQACIHLSEHLRDLGAPKTQLLMDFATRERVMAEYLSGNRYVARKFFGRDELFLDPMPAPDAAIAAQSLPADSYATMREFVAPFLRDLVTRYV